MLKINTLFAGRYGIIAKIGSGGMADVYKAQDVTEKKLVALKVLKDSLSNDPDSIKHFRMEGAQAAKIQSSNVVNVFDVGAFNGTYYIAMELVNGITLKEYIRRKGTLGSRETLAISAQVACGLRAAHARQIVHRDIKPQNIILSREGKVKVTDFGIADSIAGDGEKGNFTVGSVYYIAPEQAKGESCDERSDIYSLGIVMYEMITGKVPFDKDTSVAVALAHMNESLTPPSSLNPDCPRALEQIIFRCTQKSAARRYHNCTELLSDLKIAVNDPDYDFGQKEKATILKSNTLIFEKSGEKSGASKTSSERTSSRKESVKEERAPKTAVRPKKTVTEEEETPKNKEKKTKLPRTLFDKIISGVAVLVGAISLCLLVYIIVSFSGCNLRKPVNPEDETLITKAASDYNPETDAKVPNVIGMSLQDAINALKDANLNYKISSEIEYSDEYELGTIMKQSYLEGTIVAKNSTIVILMSAGSDKFLVAKAYLGGKVQNFRNDIAKLTDVIDVTFTRQTSNTVPANTIMKILVNGVAVTNQDIMATKGDKVEVIYSGGKPKVTVPDLANKTYDEAVNILENLGLHIGTRTEDYSDTVPKEYICGQSPSSGSYVNNGTSVNVVISLGAESLTVPSIDREDGSRMSLEEVEAALESKGFRNHRVVLRHDDEHGASSDAGEKYVLGLNPAAGSPISNTETEIKIYVATAAATDPEEEEPSSEPSEDQVAVPELSGSWDDALKILTDNGLTGHKVMVFTLNEQKSGLFISSDPATGTNVNKGTDIAVHIGRYANFLQLTKDQIEAQKRDLTITYVEGEYQPGNEGKCILCSITEGAPVGPVTVTLGAAAPVQPSAPSSEEPASGPVAP